jgi:hypothetical protein
MDSGREDGILLDVQAKEAEDGDWDGKEADAEHPSIEEEEAFVLPSNNGEGNEVDDEAAGEEEEGDEEEKEIACEKEEEDDDDEYSEAGGTREGVKWYAESKRPNFSLGFKITAAEH